jgi:hypothetical protein
MAASYTLRDMPPELWRRIKAAAAYDGISIKVWLLKAAKEKLNNDKSKKEDAMRLSEIIEKMGERESVEAPGSETIQWQHFVDECRTQYGAMPWQIDDIVPDPIVDNDFAAYWTAIAENRFKDAEEHGEVPEDWHLDLEDN